ncbi:hypothetical protein DSO57_1038894 [Entomophthora muscae]|uniref:Uncharacterized protein n=1 Tax=Entomophthora muscae TaxID=34485 RepID=A0ACC2RPH1_9FUNG|nr:hypothetical protein DSO57_1038894 [Entomophthora muscae]
MESPGNSTVAQTSMQSCPTCNSTNISKEDETFCEDCGHLFKKCALEYSEQSTYSEARYQNYGPGKVDLNTKSMKEDFRASQMKKKLRDYAVALGLQGCESRAHGIYEEAVKSGKFRTINRGKNLMYASLYFAAIEKKLSITFRRFLEIDATANIFLIGRIYKKVVDVLKPVPQQQDPKSLTLKMLGMLNENSKESPDIFSNLVDGLDFNAISKIALKITCISKKTWISEGRPLAPIVAASNVIAFQFVHKTTLTYAQAGTLFAYQGVGSAGNKRYYEIKELILQLIAKKYSGVRLEDPRRFYLFTSLLFDLSDADFDSTNSCLLRTEACHEKQQISTQNAAQHLTTRLAFDDSKLSFGLDSDILVRERALLLGIPYSAVSGMCARDLEVRLDQMAKTHLPLNSDDLDDELCNE